MKKNPQGAVYPDVVTDIGRCFRSKVPLAKHMISNFCSERSYVNKGRTNMYKAHQTEKKGLGYNFKEVIKTTVLNKSLLQMFKTFY